MTFIDPLQDGKSRIELIDYMGGDLQIANDARASFDRVSTEFTDKDAKLIRYLIEHDHTSPLRGTVFKFRVKCPLFLARQWFKHLIASNHNDEQLGWNEKSFRYVEIDDSNEFYIPQQFHRQSKNNKQATVDELEPDTNDAAVDAYERQCESSYQTYQFLLSLGVGREEARGVLVPSVYTSWVWTASLQSTLNFITLRQGHGAQRGIRSYALAITELIKPIVPVAMDAWESTRK